MAWIGSFRQQQQIPQPQVPQLTWEDLYHPRPVPMFPPPPQPVSELPEDVRSAQRMQIIASLGAALSQGAHDPGQLGVYVAQSVQQNEAARQQAIAEANQRQQQQYLMARQRAEEEQQAKAAEIADQQAQMEAKAAAGLYAKITEAEPGLAEQARQAATYGDMKSLSQLYQQVPRMAFLRQQGIDPYDPSADSQLEAKVKAQQDEEARAAKWEEFQKEQGVRQQNEMALLSWRAKNGLLWAPTQADGEKAGRVVERRDGVYLVDPRTGKMQKIEGINPEQTVDQQAHWQQIRDPITGRAVGWGNPNNPQDPIVPFHYPPGMEPGAKKKKDEGGLSGFLRGLNPFGDDEPQPPPIDREHEAPTPGKGAKSPLRPRAKAPSAPPSEQILSAAGAPLSPALRAQVEADLRAGKSPAEIIQQIRAALAGTPR